MNERYKSHNQMAVAGMMTFDLQQSSFELHAVFLELEEAKNELGIPFLFLEVTAINAMFTFFFFQASVIIVCLKHLWNKFSYVLPWNKKMKWKLCRK